MKHYVEIIGQGGYVESVINMESTDETIAWLARNPDVKCMIDELDRFEWEFVYLPEYPNEVIAYE